MRLAIADPPYPPFVGSGGRKNRASRWYGDGQRSRKDARMVADFHPEAHRWDDPAEHRALLEFLLDEFDGWAIATSPDGVAAYGPLPAACRLMAWVLDALTCQPTDEVVDLFGGSGGVADAIASYRA